MTKFERKIISWIAMGEVGTSSLNIAFTALGQKIRASNIAYPFDPIDFKRCLLLIKAVPGIKTKFKKVARLSPYWAACIKYWDEIEDSFMHEVKGWLNGKDYNIAAPLTYDLMQRIYKDVDNRMKMNSRITGKPTKGVDP